MLCCWSLRDGGGRHTEPLASLPLRRLCRPAAGVGRSGSAFKPVGVHSCLPLWHRWPAQAHVRLMWGGSGALGGMQAGCLPCIQACACCTDTLLSHEHRAPPPPLSHMHIPHSPWCSEEQQERLLEGCRAVLGAAAFRFAPPWARIISGADEGVYGWVALNYLAGAAGRGCRWESSSNLCRGAAAAARQRGPPMLM